MSDSDPSFPAATMSSFRFWTTQMRHSPFVTLPVVRSTWIPRIDTPGDSFDESWARFASVPSLARPRHSYMPSARSSYSPTARSPSFAETRELPATGCHLPPNR